jgi:NADH dehydrogenase
MGTARLPLEWMLLDASNIDLVEGVVVKVSPKEKTLTLASGRHISYDTVVFALGSVTTYFNIEGLHEHSFGIKTSEEIFELRRHLHDKVLTQPTDETNYVVVGAGPTGVELAGALGNYLQNISRNHGRQSHNISIWLVDVAPRILPQMSEKSARVVEQHLQKSGVKILTNTKVEKESLHSLKTSSTTIKTHTVIWTAGTATNPFYKEQGEIFTFDQRGRVKVNKHLEAGKDMYVIGDNASTRYSGLALTAIWHANFVAKDIRRKMASHRRPKKYEYTPIQIVPAGEKWAILQYRNFEVHGRIIAWVRKVADYLGYSDVLGYVRALTIWTNFEKTEDGCEICHKS